MLMLQDLLRTENVFLLAVSLIILIVIVVADRLARRGISRYANRLKLEPHVANILKLITRILVVAAGLIAILSVYGLPTEWFLSISALSGAAIGFASTQTVGNFLAGLYVMISRPFMVGDYVRIGAIEGRIGEITINYIKIYTPTYNITEIPNRKVLDSTITNYSGRKNMIDYSFQVGFPHADNCPTSQLIGECIEPTLQEFFEAHREALPKKPEASMCKLDRLERAFMIRMFFPESKIDEFYDLQPQLMQSIASSWEALKESKQ
jgi:hypothetical protein